jgi:uncharacterized RDD family membrane protein YckC
MAWYYEVNRQPRGPVSDEEFLRLVQAGTIAGEMLVWQEGWAEWRPYSSVNPAQAAAPNPLKLATAPRPAGGLDGYETAVCAHSGQSRPKREMFEYEGRWIAAEYKAEFFQRLREGVKQTRDVEYATFWQRFRAKFVDGVLIWVIGLIPNAALGLLLLGSIHLFDAENSGASSTNIIIYEALTFIIGIGLGVGYQIFFIRRHDATPGKKIVGIKVLRSDGAKLSIGRIVGRHFSEFASSMIMGIGYLMVIFDKEERRALHDRMCDTRVIVDDGR